MYDKKRELVHFTTLTVVTANKAFQNHTSGFSNPSIEAYRDVSDNDDSDLETKPSRLPATKGAFSQL